MAHIYRSCQQKEPDCCFELLGFDVMLDANLKPWMLEVNHTPSFNAETGVDETIKSELLRDTLDIIQLSVEHRKEKETQIQNKKKQQEITGTYKRMSAKEHCDKVKFDPMTVAQKLPSSGFSLIYPKDTPGDDPDLYLKIHKKAHNLWKLATGTVTKKRPGDIDEKQKKKKPRKKKHKPKKRISSAAHKKGGTAVESEQSQSEDGTSSEDDESNWKDGPQAEEQAVTDHLKSEAKMSKLTNHGDETRQ